MSNEFGVRHGGRRWSKRRTAIGVAVATATLAILVPAVVASAAPKVKPDKTAKTQTYSQPFGSMASVADQIGARKVWRAGHTGSGVNVAVVDTGVAVVHALVGPKKVVAAVDLSAEASVNDARYLDTYGHGTHIAGIIAGRDEEADPAAVTPDPTKFLGIAPDAGLISLKTADNTGMVDVSHVIAAIDWAIDHRAEQNIRVLNLSYGTDSNQNYQIDPVAHAVERAWKAGIVVVTAAGNDGKGARRMANPATDPFVIAVAGAEPKGDSWTIPKWSSSGDGTRNPDLAAPGVSIESLRAPGSRIDLEHPEGYVDGYLFKGSGSSQSAAVVSGAVALMLSARPELTPDDVKYLLRSSAIPYKDGHQQAFAGQGVIQVDKAIAAPLPAVGTRQSWTASTGTGSLESSRGSSHMILNGMELTGEVTAIGAPWRSGAIAPYWQDDAVGTHQWRGDTWPIAAWKGVVWSGDTWPGITWNPKADAIGGWGSTQSVTTTTTPTTTLVWDGKTWREATWEGKTWRDATWEGKTWREYEWLGGAWRVGSWS